MHFFVQKIKYIVPSNARIRIRTLFIRLKDLLTLRYFYFAKPHHLSPPLPRQFTKSQPIRKNQYSENKKDNLRLAIHHLEDITILPEHIFSFWNLIPAPVADNGFKQGRNLVGNQLALDYGGGLCQLSGLIYHMILEAGLEILERHPHSLDIYTQATRYTPLGSDATVVYGYKDLRFRNNLGFPLSFQFEVLTDEILIHLCAPHPILKRKVEFEVEEKELGKAVRVIRVFDNKKEICSTDFYKNLRAK